MALSLCSATGGNNTGQVDCDLVRGNLKTILIGSSSFNAADYASTAAFRTAFVPKLKLSAKNAQKIFPFPIAHTVTDRTIAAKEATLGDGTIVPIARARPSYELDVLANSSLEKKLIKFYGKILPVFIYDDYGQVWGVKDGANNFVGAKYIISMTPAGFSDYSKAPTTKIHLTIINAQDFTENAWVMPSDIVDSDLQGLVDADLKFLSNISNVYKIGVSYGSNILTGGLNLASLYSTQLASASMWVATIVSTGAAQTITSVAYDSTLQAWTVTFDTTTYGALAVGTKIALTLADPVTLDTAGVVGIEGGTVILTK